MKGWREIARAGARSEGAPPRAAGWCPGGRPPVLPGANDRGSREAIRRIFLLASTSSTHRLTMSPGANNSYGSILCCSPSLSSGLYLLAVGVCAVWAHKHDSMLALRLQLPLCGDTHYPLEVLVGGRVLDMATSALHV